jgi:predicted RNA-binding Zn-ribbon protein involved in translation (DUF1610 family)
MIERDDDVGAITLRCDDCGDLLEGDFNADDFHGMIEYAKTHGWSIKPDGEGGWEHKCPDCAGNSGSRLERQKRLLGL